MKNHFCGLLFLSRLLHLIQGDSLYQQESPIYSELYNLCYRASQEVTEALNIGQHWGSAKPTATTSIDLLAVTSPASSFDFRTFDPEGVIFYGDTKDGQDWFLLGLRNGRPEIQVRNFISQVGVTSGNRIDDGQWHRVTVENEGNSILLHIDHVEALRIWHITTTKIVDTEGTMMRIAVGGLLTNQSNLLVPMNPAMDGCMRSWNWMNQTSSWLTSPPKEDPSKACFEQLQRGSFFSGTGMAVFHSRGFMPTDDPKAETWALTLELTVQPNKRTGFILAVSAFHNRPVLTLRMRGETFLLEVGRTTALSLPFPSRLCQGSRLLLSISKAHLSWELDEMKVTQVMPAQEYRALRDAWQDQRGQLFIGGTPNLQELYPSEAMVFFEGCLQKVLIQGQPLNMDEAVYKSDSILAHSCPRSKFFSPKPVQDVSG